MDCEDNEWILYCQIFFKEKFYPAYIYLISLRIYYICNVSRYSNVPIIVWIKRVIDSILDFFYPIFKPFLPENTYRYLVCGGGTTLLGLFSYFMAYNFIFLDPIWYIFGFSITRYIAAYIFSFFVAFPVGFFLNKFVVFTTSTIKGRIQLFRYLLIQGINILLNWAMLHLFVGYFGFWATPSQTLTTGILIIISYFFQKYVTFKTEDSKIM